MPTSSQPVLVIVTRQMIRVRAVALAASQGRTAPEVSKADWELAKHQLVQLTPGATPVFSLAIIYTQRHG